MPYVNIRITREGTTASLRDPTIDPSGGTDDLAHFYRFSEFYLGKRIDAQTGKLKDPAVTIDWPKETDLRPMEDVPPDGWVGSAAEADLAKFDAKYSEMLKNLHAAWATDNPDPTHTHPSYKAAVTAMNTMKLLAIALMEKEMSPGKTYGPRFRAVL